MENHKRRKWKLYHFYSLVPYLLDKTVQSQGAAIFFRFELHHNPIFTICFYYLPLLPV